MRKILALLYRSRIFLLFALLEVIAFSWISRSRSYQRSVLLNSSSRFSGYVLETSEGLQDYFDLGMQNDKLAKENARLHSMEPSSLFSLRSDSLSVADSSYMVRYTYMEGEVINSSYLKARNYMTLNRGEIHGVEPNMGIIGSNGVVGIVKDVSSHFSTAIPLINPGFRLSGRISGNSFFGPVMWKDDDYQYAYLIDIPRYAEINPGDTVVSDSRSQIFPPGIPIGIIESFELQDDQNFYEIKMKLTTNFASIDHVYIIKDKLKIEQQQLEEQLEE